MTQLIDTMQLDPPIGSGEAVVLVLPSNVAEARSLLDRLEAELRSREIHDRDVFSIVMALEEALINAMKHGNQLDPSKNVHVSYWLNESSFTVHVRDEGPGFDPFDIPDPTEVENVERPSGRGLLMMRHYMNEVCYNSTGNIVFMQRRFTLL